MTSCPLCNLSHRLACFACKRARSGGSPSAGERPKVQKASKRCPNSCTGPRKIQGSRPSGNGSGDSEAQALEPELQVAADNSMQDDGVDKPQRGKEMLWD
eukprot:1372904-Amphidinium_carterae.1